MSDKKTDQQLKDLFGIEGKTAVVTGGSGELGQAMAQALARAGAQVAILGRRVEAAQKVVDAINSQGGKSLALACDVTDHNALDTAQKEIYKQFGVVDILVNGAGGNHPQATTSPTLSFFDLEDAAIHHVLALNFTGTLKTCQVFGQEMARHKQGIIINIASMNSLRPLTRIPAYSAAKAAIVNFTQWLAVHMAQEYSPNIRVNAIAPGFFLTEQNRFLLTDANSSNYTARGQSILAHTPMGRLGEADDLISTLLWLISPGSRFVTGIVVPVDGGFSAFSGV